MKDIDDNDFASYHDSPAEDDPWFTTREALELLGVSRSTLTNWRKKGLINAYWIGLTPAIRFKKSELLSLIDQINSVTRV